MGGIGSGRKYEGKDKKLRNAILPKKQKLKIKKNPNATTYASRSHRGHIRSSQSMRIKLSKFGGKDKTIIKTHYKKRTGKQITRRKLS